MTNLPQTIKPGVSTSREWSVAKFESSARLRGYDPVGRLLAIFDVLDDVINRADREARSFVTNLAGTDLLAELTRTITRLAVESSLRDTENAVLSLRVLVTGAAMSALAGDYDAASRARSMAHTLIDRHSDAVLRQEPVARAQPFQEVDRELNSFLDWDA